MHRYYRALLAVALIAVPAGPLLAAFGLGGGMGIDEVRSGKGSGSAVTQPVNCLLVSGSSTNCLLVSGSTTNVLLIK